MADLIDRGMILEHRTTMWDEALGNCAVVLVEDIEKASAVDPISRLRKKYGWRSADAPPHDSRRVIVWTNRGEYIARYDHKWKCWRTTRDGLKITHWREQCGPESWPAAE